MMLGRGDTRDCFVVIDRHGDYRALNTKTVGARAQNIRAKLTDLDRTQLPSIEQARQLPQKGLQPAVALVSEFGSPQQSPQGGGVTMSRHPVEETFDAFQNTVGALFDVLMPGVSPGNPAETVYQDRAYHEGIAAAMRRADAQQRPADAAPERDIAAERAAQDRALADSPRIEAQPTPDQQPAAAEAAHADEHRASLTRQHVTSEAIAAAATAPDAVFKAARRRAALCRHLARKNAKNKPQQEPTV